MGPIMVYESPTGLRLDFALNVQVIYSVKHHMSRGLTTFGRRDPRTKKVKVEYQFFKHEESRNTLKFPIVDKKKLKEYLDLNNFEYLWKPECTYTPRRLTDIHINEGCKPRDTIQKESVKFLINNPDMPRKGLQLQAGRGKTFCAIYSAVKLGEVTIIIVSGLVQQWVDSINKFTNGADKTWVIQGNSSVEQLYTSGTQPELFVCSLETVREWVKYGDTYEGLPTWQQFLTDYGIGMKVMDEVHLNFHAITMIDLESVVPHNVYLTATFDSGNSQIKRIFDRIYPPDMKSNPGEFCIYVNTTFIGFRGVVPERRAKNCMGYNHVKYEKYMLQNRTALLTWYEFILRKAIERKYIPFTDPKAKLLIFCSTKEFVKEICRLVTEDFPDKKVHSYLHEDPDTVLEECNIIVSTHKSCGVGTDIKDLFTVINTVSYQSPTQVLQAFGRLRELPCGTKPEYVDMADLNNRSHIRHQYERTRLIRPVSSSYQEVMAMLN